MKILKKFFKQNNNIICLKNEENFTENLVAPALKLFGNEMARNETGDGNAEKSWTLPLAPEADD